MMEITPKNLIRHELIGLRAKVVESSNPSLLGIEGVIVDETKNMIVIDTGTKEVKIPKLNAKFHFFLPKVKVEVSGRLLVGRPEDRIKKTFRD